MKTIIYTLFFSLFMISVSFAQNYDGSLAAGDSKLTNGEYYDTYYITVQSGQTITLDLKSSQFDTYVMLAPPEGETLFNDDYDGSSQHSYIETVATESGEWKVYATSYEADETGSYRLEIDISSHSGVVSNAGASGERQNYNGELANGDNKLSSGEYYDTYYFEATAGQEIIIDVTSRQFDTYVMLKSPAGESTDNNDHNGSSSHSHLTFTANESGSWRAIVTSNAPNETGSYGVNLTVRDGRISQGESANYTATNNSASSSPSQTFSGSLASGDGTLNDGEYYDVYEMQFTAGQRVNLRLQSSDFDAYLLVTNPDDYMLYNDDRESEDKNSELTILIERSGVHRITTTSLEAAEVGSYTLSVSTQNTNVSGQRGQSGTLAGGDQVLETGEYFDDYYFQMTAGQNLEVDMVSSEFDPFILVISPSGEQFQNDDYGGKTDRSHLMVPVTESGNWRILATTYEAEVGGSYTITYQRDAGGSYVQAQNNVVAQNTRQNTSQQNPNQNQSQQSPTNNSTQQQTQQRPVQTQSVAQTSTVSIPQSEVDTNIPRTRMSNPDAVAVVIGIQEYINPDVPNVDFAVHDAETMKAYLINSLGFSEENIIYEPNATKVVFERVFGTKEDYRGQLFNYMRPNRSDVFVFYSGHGAPDVEKGKTFFVPSDADPNYIKFNGYAVSQMYANIGQLPAKSVTVVVDACFSGVSDGGSLIQNVSALLRVANPAMTVNKSVIFSAATDTQVSTWYPEKGHGLFTYTYLRGLQGEADSNGDKKVTAEEMEAYLTEEVPYLARRKFNREQQPQAIIRDQGRVLIDLN